MRIVAGQLKGRRLGPVPDGVRPTSDRLREALFHVLSPEIAGSRWLDLFAGTGAVGLEALSRGAGFVHFNDSSATAVKAIRQNLSRCELSENFAVSSMDAGLLLKKKLEPPFTHVFVDPPYGFRGISRLLKEIAESPSLETDALILLEVYKKTDPAIADEAGLKQLRTLKAGDSHIWFLGRV